MRGQAVAGMLARLEVTGLAEALATVALTRPDARPGSADSDWQANPGTPIALSRAGAEALWQGTFLLPEATGIQALCLHVTGSDGHTMAVRQMYRLRGAREGTIQRLAQTEAQSFFAVRRAPDGTVWAAGTIQSLSIRSRSAMTSSASSRATPSSSVQSALSADRHGWARWIAV